MADSTELRTIRGSNSNKSKRQMWDVYIKNIPWISFTIKKMLPTRERGKNLFLRSNIKTTRGVEFRISSRNDLKKCKTKNNMSQYNVPFTIYGNLTYLTNTRIVFHSRLIQHTIPRKKTERKGTLTLGSHPTVIGIKRKSIFIIIQKILVNKFNISLLFIHFAIPWPSTRIIY